MPLRFFVISGLRRRVIGVNEIFALLGCYAGFISSYLPTFRDKLSALSSVVKQSKETLDP